MEHKSVSAVALVCGLCFACLASAVRSAEPPRIFVVDETCMPIVVPLARDVAEVECAKAAQAARTRDEFWSTHARAALDARLLVLASEIESEPCDAIWLERLANHGVPSCRLVAPLSASPREMTLERLDYLYRELVLRFPEQRDQLQANRDRVLELLVRSPTASRWAFAEPQIQAP